MLRSAVVHMTPVNQRSTIASVRISQMLADVLNAPIIDRELFCLPAVSGKDGKSMLGPWDALFIVNSPSAFCSFLDDLVKLAQNSSRVIWVMNDYKIYPPTQLRRYLYGAERKLELWGTLPQLPEEFTKLKSYGNLPKYATKVLNWNALTFNCVTRRDPTRDGIVYWGAFRQESSRKTLGRQRYFEQYLDHSAVTISTTKKAQAKFNELCPQAEIIDPFQNLVHDIQQWPGTVYIEDEFSHRVFCQPANRFYEALSAGIAMYVEPRASATLTKAGFEMSGELGVVCDDEEMLDRVKSDSQLVALRQREAWAQRDWRGLLYEDVRRSLAAEGLLP